VSFNISRLTIHASRLTFFHNLASDLKTALNPIDMEKQKKKREFPHTYVIIFALIVLSAILTWIVPGGEFSRELKDVNGINREVIVPGSFETVENQPQSWQIFSSIFEGMLRTKDIIFYILMIGGAFWIMN